MSPHNDRCSAPTPAPLSPAPCITRSLALLVVLSPTIFTLPPAAAVPIVTGLHRTGEGVVPVVPVAASLSSSSFAPLAEAVPIDPHWRVVALPGSPPVIPYEAAVFSGRGGGFYVPSTWYHGIDGLAGAGWVGLRLETTDSLFRPATGPQSDYTAIYATRFNASEAGRAFFDLSATADNALSFFVNGSLSGLTTLLPSIVGGTQIGTEQRNLNRLHQFKGFADVLAGENTLYAVVRDRYVLNPATNIGGYGQTGLFVAEVPEPGTLASLLAGVACILTARCRRPRPRASQSDPGCGTSARAEARRRSLQHRPGHAGRD